MTTATVERVTLHGGLDDLTAPLDMFRRHIERNRELVLGLVDGIPRTLGQSFGPTLAHAAMWGARARLLARARREALRIARGNAALAVDVQRLTAQLLGRGWELAPAQVAAALAGDVDALDMWRDMAADGDDLARQVLDLIARRDELDAAVSHVVEMYLDAMLPAMLDALEVEHEPPPAVAVRGSIERNGPNAAHIGAPAAIGRRDATRTRGGKPPG